MFKPNPELEQKLLNDRVRAFEALRTAMVTWPQQRLGQLVSNALHGSHWEADVFYAPDADLAAALESYAYGSKPARRGDEATEIERLRKALHAIKVMTDTALHPAKSAPNGFAVISKLNEISATALKTPSSG
jgi:hypothetical protein